MNSATLFLFDAILRSTLALGIAALIVRGLQLWIKPSLPRWQQAAWALVLLQGVIFLQFSVAIPWYSTEIKKDIAIESVQHESLNTTPDNRTINPLPVILTNSDRDLITKFNWFSLAGSLWITGCGLILLWWISAYIISAKRLRNSVPATETWARGVAGSLEAIRHPKTNSPAHHTRCWPHALFIAAGISRFRSPTTLV